MLGAEKAGKQLLCVQVELSPGRCMESVTQSAPWRGHSPGLERARCGWVQRLQEPIGTRGDVSVHCFVLCQTPEETLCAACRHGDNM